MYPPKFDYHRAGSVSEAISMLQQNPGAKLLAGGHSLIPVLKLRFADPGMLIDIGRIAELKGICKGDGKTSIGALTTHSMIETSDELPDILPEAASWIGDPQVRNRGTVGGNIAHADPASDLPTVFLALGATIHLAGASGTREVSADNFFTDLFETDMGEEEILTGISIPEECGGTGYAKLFNPASRYAMVGAGASVHMSDGKCTSARVAIGGLTPKATRAPSVEAALVGTACSEADIAAAAEKVAADLGDEVMGDMHASAEYRRGVVAEFVKRALTKAVSRA